MRIALSIHDGADTTAKSPLLMPAVQPVDHEVILEVTPEAWIFNARSKAALTCGFLS